MGYVCTQDQSFGFGFFIFKPILGGSRDKAKAMLVAIQMAEEIRGGVDR